MHERKRNSKRNGRSQRGANHANNNCNRNANNFGKYLNSVIQGQEMIITKNGTPVARIIPQNQAISYLTDSLTGILKEERELYFRRELERLDRESIYEDGALSTSARNIKNLMQTQKIPLETAFAWLNIPEAKQRLIKEELKE